MGLFGKKKNGYNAKPTLSRREAARYMADREAREGQSDEAPADAETDNDDNADDD